MARLDKDRQIQLEPQRLEKAKEELEKLGFHTSVADDEKSISFLYKEHTVIYFPYSGWATGKSIKDGRGLQNLLKQLKS